MKIMNGNSSEQGRYFFLSSWPKIACQIERSLYVTYTSKNTDKNNIYMKIKSSSEACLGLRVFQMFLWREVE